MQCECFVRAAYVCAAQPLTLETIEEKLVKDQQHQLSSLQPRVPSSTEQLRSIAPQLDPTHLCSNTSPLPPPLLESSDQLSGTPAPTPVMKVNGREGGASSDHPAHGRRPRRSRKVGLSCACAEQSQFDLKRERRSSPVSSQQATRSSKHNKRIHPHLTWLLSPE